MSSQVRITCEESAAVGVLTARCRALVQRGGRRLVGIVGAPGAGKSTLAAAIARELGADAARVVPMDGFHLAGEELARLGRADRKGAIDTFDAAGYVALLRRLRANEPGTVYAPRYTRTLEEALAGAIEVPSQVPLVITEGNYLLDQSAPWNEVPRLLDETWFIELPDDVRRVRLVARHVAGGRTPAAAQDWMEHTDEPNARRIAAGMARATVVVGLLAPTPPLAPGQ